jgi:hypothetical protein
MAATGPSFCKGMVDETPVSNADIGRTMAHVLGLKIADKGKLVGRVIDEVLPGGTAPDVSARTIRSESNAAGLATVLMTQNVGAARYFDAAGFAGRTVGLGEEHSPARRSAADTSGRR